MDMQLVKQNSCVSIAQELSVFYDKEIKILEEIVFECKNNPASSYCLIENFKEDILSGFIIFGKTPLTESSWDIYWLVVNKNFQNKGIGTRLIRDAEIYMVSNTSKEQAVIRVETSSRKEYEPARKTYRKNGYILSGMIPDFYGFGDDLITFSKKIVSKDFFLPPKI